MKTTLSTLASDGADLVLVATAELADHFWQDRRRLLQLAGAQRLWLTIELPGQQPLLMTWQPPALPEALAVSGPSRRRRSHSPYVQ